jgi:polyketide-type polyunsaturated fatty acid synthase PfaA
MQPFQPIAITGLSALFPQARNIDEFWRLILSNRDCMTEVPKTHWLIEDYYDADPKAPAKTYSRHGAFLQEVPFDPVTYGIPPNLLPSTDIAQVLALMLAREVLEDASGGQVAKLKLDRTSVILGVASATEMISSMSGLLSRPMWIEGMRRAGIPEPQVQAAAEKISALLPEWNESTFPGCLGNVVAGRVANRFNLGGTNCVTDAACASSLAALHLGLSELQLGVSDRVITGGVDAFNTIFMYMCFSKTPAMSASGKCSPFSVAADGTMMGEGGGMLVLRRLEDAERDGDKIYAVIRGLGSSSDGRSKSVYAPRPEGQSVALQRCYDQAGYSPAEVGLVEAHGTGTTAGDLCEVTALKEIFAAAAPARQAWCALGSVKSQIGHTKGAAGSAGLIKVALALRHQTLPPTANIAEPNPKLGFTGSPLYLNTSPRPWIEATGTPRRGSVSSFGFGGTNFHVALEEYRGPLAAPRVRAFGAEVFLASAPSVAELKTSLAAWSGTAAGDAFARAAQASQNAFDATAPWRVATLAASPAELASKLTRALALLGDTRAEALPADELWLARGTAPLAADAVAFLFPGQGSQSVGMGGALPTHFAPAMAAWEQVELASPPAAGAPRLCDLVYPPAVFNAADAEAQETTLRRTENAQPALDAVSLSYLCVLRAAGITPALVAGHSYGELVALHAAGVFDLPDLLRISRRRGELMAEFSAQKPGAMTAVVQSAAETAALLGAEFPGCVVANDNSPRQCVVAGPVSEIAKFEAALTGRSINFRRLPVATAFHSSIVADACAPFGEFLATVPFAAPKLPVFSNTTADVYPADARAARAALGGQLAAPVRFVDQIRGMHTAGARLFVEVGAGNVLSGLTRQILGAETAVIALNSKGKSAELGLLTGLAQLAVSGLRVDWKILWQDYRAPRAAEKLSAATLPVGGYNLGRPYPSRDGSKTAPVPVPAPVVVIQPSPVAAALSASRPTTAAPLPVTPSLPPSPTLLTMSVPPAPAAPSLQASVARAHETFLRTMGEAHRSYLAAVTGTPLPAAPTALAQPSTPAPALVTATTPRAPAPLPVALPVAALPTPSPRAPQPAPIAQLPAPSSKLPAQSSQLQAPSS